MDSSRPRQNPLFPGANRPNRPYFHQEKKVGKNDEKQEQEDPRNRSKKTVIKMYQNFISKMNKKGYKVNYSIERFLELAKNYDDKSIFETEGGCKRSLLELEAKGIVNNLRRPSNPKVRLDFMAEWADSKKRFL